jgi:Protein of unknown function (DUF3306)
MTRPEDKTDTGFLGRWSKRKQEAQRAPHVEDVAPEAEPVVAATEEPEPPMPSLDDIIPGADVAAFFQKHVPDSLRQAALRKLWTTDPDIKGFIEMADYQWDFNNPDSIPGWSSTLAGSDVQKIVENLFKPWSGLSGRDTMSPEVAAPYSPDASESALADAGMAKGSEAQHADSRMLSEGSGKRHLSDDPEEPAHVAVQKTPEESSAYEMPRKKHGGALPT